MNPVLKFLLLIAGISVLVVGSSLPASAHERRTVGGFQFVVGWKIEPSFSDVSNAVQIFIRNADGTPATDVGDGLQVEVITGTQKSDQLPLKSVFNSPGEYNAPLLPTRPGTYTFHFVGTIRGQKVDESFTSSEKTFNDIQNASDIAFPVKDPTRGELTQKVDRQSTRQEDAQAKIADLQAQLKTAQDAATLDKNLAIVGIGLGALGTVALIAVLGLELRRRRTTASPHAVTTAAEPEG